MSTMTATFTTYADAYALDAALAARGIGTLIHHGDSITVEWVEPCPVCAHRARYYPGTGPCDAHAGDVWPTRKDN